MLWRKKIGCNFSAKISMVHFYANLDPSSLPVDYIKDFHVIQCEETWFWWTIKTSTANQNPPDFNDLKPLTWQNRSECYCPLLWMLTQLPFLMWMDLKRVHDKKWMKSWGTLPLMWMFNCQARKWNIIWIGKTCLTVYHPRCFRFRTESSLSALVVNNWNQTAGVCCPCHKQTRTKPHAGPRLPEAAGRVQTWSWTVFKKSLMNILGQIWVSAHIAHQIPHNLKRYYRNKLRLPLITYERC